MKLRRALDSDIARASSIFAEHIEYEKTHPKWTIWEEGVYPTAETVSKAYARDALYVLDSSDDATSSSNDSDIVAVIIMDQIPPTEYVEIEWPLRLTDNEVLIVHLLCADPAIRGQGLGEQALLSAIEWAREHDLRAVRLDTGEQNLPARQLYAKLGFTVVSTRMMVVGGKLTHPNHMYLELGI